MRMHIEFNNNRDKWKKWLTWKKMDQDMEMDYPRPFLWKRKKWRWNTQNRFCRNRRNGIPKTVFVETDKRNTQHNFWQMHDNLIIPRAFHISLYFGSINMPCCSDLEELNTQDHFWMSMETQQDNLQLWITYMWYFFAVILK